MTGPSFPDTERRRRLAVRHRLVPDHRIDDVATLVDDLVALHSSDPATVFLSAGVRMADPSIDRIEAALYEERSVVRHHAMRRTLWVMTTETAARAHASSGRKVAGAERRTLLKRLAETPEIDDPGAWLDAALDAMTSLVESDGPIMTKAMGERLPELRVPVPYPGPRKSTVEIKAHTKVIQLAGFEGRVVRTRPQGSWIGSQYAWAPMTAWIADGVDHLDTAEAQASLIGQWLDRFGPGTEVDLTWWTGWTKTDVRRALAAVEAVEVTLDSGAVGWIGADDPFLDEPVPDAEPWAAVLPGLDPTPMGWKERTWYLDDDIAERVFDRFGNAGPTLWVDGSIVGGWTQRSDGELVVECQRDIGEDATVRLEHELDRLRAFIGGTRFRVRFPSRNEADLLLPDR